MGTTLFGSLALLLSLVTFVHGLEIEHRSGGVGGGSGGGGERRPAIGPPLDPGTFLPRFPSFSSSSQSFSRGGSSSFSKSYSSSGAHAFSNSYSVGPDGERRLVHQASSQSGSNASNEQNSGLSTQTRAFSSAGTTADGRAYSESGAETSRDASSASSSDASSSSFSSSSSGGIRGTAESASAASSSSSSASQSHSFASSGGGDRGAQASSEAFAHGTRLAQVPQVTQLPVIRPVVIEEIVPTPYEEPILISTPVPIVEEVNYFPINLAAGNQISGQVIGQGNSQKQTTGTNTIQSSVSTLNNKQRKPNGPIRGYPSPVLVQEQQKVTNLYDSSKIQRPASPLGGYPPVYSIGQPEYPSVTLESHKERKPIPVRGYQSVVTNQQQTQHTRPTSGSIGTGQQKYVSVDNVGIENIQKAGVPIRGYSEELHHTFNGRPTTSVSGYHTEKHRVSSDVFSTEGVRNTHTNKQISSNSQGDGPVYIIKYESNPDQFNRQRESQDRVQLGQVDSIKNILDTNQPFLQNKDQRRTNSQNGGLQRVTFESVLNTGTPNYYQPQINTENVVREGVYQQTSNGQKRTNVNNILSQLTRETIEANKRPIIVVNNDQNTSKLTDTHSVGVGIHSRPHEEDIDNIVRIVESSKVKTSPSTVEKNTRSGPEGAASFTTDRILHTAESNDGKRGGFYDQLVENGERVLMFNGRRYTSEDLAKEFNRTRPTMPPSPPPTYQTPQTSQTPSFTTQAEATSSTFDLKEHPELKLDSNAQDAKKISSSTGNTQYFGKHYHDFVPPALFGSSEFSRFFFDNYRPGFPLPAASDFAAAVAKPPSAPRVPRPRRPSASAVPTNYFIYPGTVKHESELPDFVVKDMMHQGHSFSSSISSSSGSNEGSSSAMAEAASNLMPHIVTKSRRPTRVQY